MNRRIYYLYCGNFSENGIACLYKDIIAGTVNYSICLGALQRIFWKRILKLQRMKKAVQKKKQDGDAEESADEKKEDTSEKSEKEEEKRAKEE